MDNELMKLVEELKRNRPRGKPISYECEKCKDSGMLFVLDEEGHKRARDCECMVEKTCRQRMLASGLSEDDLNKGFSDFITNGNAKLEDAKARTINFVKEFSQHLANRNNGIMFMGAPGRGKTLLGLATTNNLIRAGLPVKYMAYREKMTELKQSMTKKEMGLSDEVTYSKLMEVYKNIQVLFIDDLFKGKITESDVNIMYEIVNHRYLNKLPIIVSTEKTIETLLQVDEALGSRIVEMCKGHIIEFTSDIPNYRLI